MSSPDERVFPFLHLFDDFLGWPGGVIVDLKVGRDARSHAELDHDEDSEGCQEVGCASSQHKVEGPARNKAQGTSGHPDGQVSVCTTRTRLSVHVENYPQHVEAKKYQGVLWSLNGPRLLLKYRKM